MPQLVQSGPGVVNAGGKAGCGADAWACQFFGLLAGGSGPCPSYQGSPGHPTESRQGRTGYWETPRGGDPMGGRGYCPLTGRWTCRAGPELDTGNSRCRVWRREVAQIPGQPVLVRTGCQQGVARLAAANTGNVFLPVPGPGVQIMVPVCRSGDTPRGVSHGFSVACE